MENKNIVDPIVNNSNSNPGTININNTTQGNSQQMKNDFREKNLFNSNQNIINKTISQNQINYNDEKNLKQSINQNPNTIKSNMNDNGNQNKANYISFNLNLASQNYNEGLRLKDQFSFSEAIIKFEETFRIFKNIYPLVEDQNLKSRIEYYQKPIKDLIDHCTNQINNQFTYKSTACYGYGTKKEENVDYLECLREKKSNTVVVEKKSVETHNKTKSNATDTSKLSDKDKQKVKSESAVPEDLRNRILNEIVDTNPCVSFNDVIGLSQAKQILKEIIVLPSLRPDLFTGLRSPPRGLLLFGPPGTGKTMIAKAVATECKCTFFNISASSLTSKYLGESEKLVRGLFNLAFEKQPSVIFIDEIDSILSKRSDNENDAVKRLKTEFLVQFDGVGSDLTAKVLVIGATNRPFELDNAVLRRLPKRVYIRQFNCEERELFVKEIMKKAENTIKNEEFKKIGELTENYSNSDLKELCREAAYEPIREISSNISSIEKLRPVIFNDFLKANKNVRGTLTKDILSELEIWNSSFGAI